MSCSGIEEAAAGTAASSTLSKSAKSPKNSAAEEEAEEVAEVLPRPTGKSTLSPGRIYRGSWGSPGRLQRSGVTPRF